MERKKMVLKRCILLAGVLMLVILKTSTAFAEPCHADINGDGKVDFKDIGIMKSEMDRDDCYMVPCQADLNGDGKVNVEDMEILKAEFGRNDCLPINGDVFEEQMGTPQIGQEREFDTGEEEVEEVTSYDTDEEKDLEEGFELPTSRFKDNGDGTVTDPDSGLVWTKDANLPGDTMLFHQALDYIKKMNEGKYPNFGYTDWRLPTLNELRSLIDYTNFTRNGHIIPSEHPFQNVQSPALNSYLSNSDYPLFVSLYCRLVGHNVKTCYGKVWPVRGGGE